MENKKLSVKEIAELAGTSVATVSRVINQNGRFSKETEKRVKDIIEQYGYQPNQLARSLRVSHTNVIGMMVPDITNEFFARITKEIQKHLLEKNYMTLICSTNESVKETQEQINMLLRQKISGIIYIGRLDIAESVEIPTIYIDRDPREVNADLDDNYVMIECDNIQGGYLAGRELVQKGARNMAVVCHNQNLSTIKKRIQGFCSALKEAGMEFNPENVVDVQEVSLEEGASAAEYIMKHMPDVDGIFFTSDALGVGAIGYLTDVNVKIPEQIKLVGFDDISMAKIVLPRLTTVHQPLEEIGRLAALRILDMIRGEEIPHKRQRLPVELVVRETT